MRALNRSGFTLIELLIALVIGAVVGTATIRVIVGTQRTTQAGMEKVGVQQTLRAGIGYMTNVVRELDAEDGDIGVATATRLQFRGMRWASPSCATPVAGAGTSVVFLVDAGSVYGMRSPDAVEDSVLVFAETDTGTRSDDAWLVGAVTAVGTGACTSGSNALSLTVEISAGSGGQAAGLANVTSGSPLRGFQQEELSLFQGADSRWWMGQRTANRTGAWTAVQALVGPLTVGGLSLQYFDSTGAVTGALANIASIGMALRAESSNRVRTQSANIDFARDSLISRVALRNNPRF
jgi:prepilin-type N-terminal cleavage/methylation domain-containing protein